LDCGRALGHHSSRRRRRIPPRDDSRYPRILTVRANTKYPICQIAKRPTYRIEGAVS
jgi:hypothetical protein